MTTSILIVCSDLVRHMTSELAGQLPHVRSLLTMIGFPMKVIDYSFVCTRSIHNRPDPETHQILKLNDCEGKEESMMHKYLPSKLQTASIP